MFLPLILVLMVLDNMSTTSSITTKITIKIYTKSYENDRKIRLEWLIFRLLEALGCGSGRVLRKSYDFLRFCTDFYGFLRCHVPFVSRTVCVTYRLATLKLRNH